MTNNKKQPWWKRSPFKKDKNEGKGDSDSENEFNDDHAEYTDDYRFHENLRKTRRQPRGHHERMSRYGNDSDDWRHGPGDPVGPRPGDDGFDSIFRKPSFGFNDSFFTDIEREFSEMRKNMDRMFQQTAQDSLDQGPGKSRSFMYGYSMHTGPDGKPEIKEWSNMPPEMIERLRSRGLGSGGREGMLPFRVVRADRLDRSCETDKCSSCGPSPGADGELSRVRSRNTGEFNNNRKSMADVMDCCDHISVTLELPGVEKDNINLEVVDDVLEIAVDSPGKDFSDIVELPLKVDPDSIEATFKNGVLNVCLKPKNAKKRKGKMIDIQ
jgi:HSP20 family molecular chaperone IbpA